MLNMETKDMTAVNDETASVLVKGAFSLLVGGDGVGTVVLQYKRPESLIWTTDDKLLDSPQAYAGTLHDFDVKVKCTVYTSGTIEVSLSQIVK